MCIAKYKVHGICKAELSILRREDMRQLSGMCWHPAESVVFTNQGGTADILRYNYSSLADLEYKSVRDFLRVKKAVHQ